MYNLYPSYFYMRDWNWYWISTREKAKILAKIVTLPLLFATIWIVNGTQKDISQALNTPKPIEQPAPERETLSKSKNTVSFPIDPSKQWLNDNREGDTTSEWVISE